MRHHDEAALSARFAGFSARKGLATLPIHVWCWSLRVAPNRREGSTSFLHGWLRLLGEVVTLMLQCQVLLPVPACEWSDSTAQIEWEPPSSPCSNLLTRDGCEGALPRLLQWLGVLPSQTHSRVDMAAVIALIALLLHRGQDVNDVTWAACIRAQAPLRRGSTTAAACRERAAEHLTPSQKVPRRHQDRGSCRFLIPFLRRSPAARPTPFLHLQGPERTRTSPRHSFRLACRGASASSSGTRTRCATCVE